MKSARQILLSLVHATQSLTQKVMGRRAWQEILGRRVTEWTAQHHLAPNAEAVRRCAELGLVRNLEIEYVNGDGKCTLSEVNATVVPAAGGDRIVNLYRDITDRKRVEQALRESEERYRLLFERNLAGVFRGTLLSRHILDCNAAYARILGYDSRQEVLTLGKLHDFYEPAEFETAKARLLNERALTNFEVRFRRKDQTPVWALVNVSLIETRDAEEPLVAGTLIDITERKQAEQALAQERDLLGTLMDNLPDYIYFKDRQSRFLRINRAHAKAFGLSDPGQAVGKTDFDFFTAEHAQQAYNDEQEVITTGKPMTAKEEKETWPDGRVTWASTTKMPFRDANGATVGTFGVSRDITERKRADKALEERTAYLNTLIEISPVGIVVLDKEERIQMCNPAFERLFLYSRQEMQGFNLDELIIPTELVSEAESLTRKTLVGASVHATSRRRRKDGTLVDVEIYAVPLVMDDKPLGLLGLYQDVTERKQAEEALAQERYLLGTLMDNLPDYIYFKDRQSRFVRTNMALAKAFGLSDPGQAVGKTDFDFFTAEHAQQAYNDEQEVITTGKPMTAKEEKETWPDGRVTWASTTKMPFRDANGAIVGTFGVSRDITERKRAEEARAFLASLVESSQDAIIGTTLEALTVSWNHGAEELYGYSAEEMIGNYVSVLYPPDLLDELAQLFEKVRQGKRINCYESVRVRKDGTRVDVSLTFSPVYDTTGKITGIATIARDITERQRAEAEMAERHRLATLVAEVGVALTGAESLRQGLQQCAEILVRDINAALARIWTVNEADKVLELEASAGKYTHLDGGHARVPMGQFKIGHIAENGEPHLTNTVQQDSWVEDPEWARREGMAAFAGYPLRVGEHVLGVVAAFARKPLTPATLQAFASVAHNLAQFIKRKRAEETLRESEEKYRALIETTGTGYVIVDMQGRVIDANPEYVRLTGHRALQEILSRRVTEWTAQHDLARTAEAVRRCAELGFTRNLEIEHVNGEGKCTPIEVNATVVPGAGGVRIVGLCRDITDRKRAEQALRESEERYRELFENASDLVYTTDLEGGLTSLNRVAERTIAYSREEAAQMNLRQLVDPRHWQRVEQTRERLLAGDSAVTLELEITAKDGRRVMLEVNPRLIYKDGKPVGMQGIGRDITGRDEREMELRHAQKLESVGRLASGIAHEINTPIQFVGDNTRFVRDSFRGLQTLLSKYQELRDAAASGAVSPDLLAAVRRVEEESDCAYLLEEIPKALTQTLDGVTRVATLVRAMKDFAHPESKEKAAADLNKALLSTLTVARNELKSVAHIETDLGNLPPVVCNISDLNQVFLNLLVNAAHAIGDVVKGTGKKGKIRVRTVAEGKTVLVTITDTGCGIPEGIRTKVFDPFFTTKGVGRGTGQGLAIARSVVVERHKGTLTFESEVGKGTSFYVRLPVESEEYSEKARAA